MIKEIDPKKISFKGSEPGDIEAALDDIRTLLTTICDSHPIGIEMFKYPEDFCVEASTSDIMVAYQYEPIGEHVEIIKCCWRHIYGNEV